MLFYDCDRSSVHGYGKKIATTILAATCFFFMKDWKTSVA